MAKNRELKKIGINPSEVRVCWVFKYGDEFPNKPFSVLCPNAEKLHSWDGNLLKKGNNEIIDYTNCFIASEKGVIGAENSGADYSYGESKTDSFEWTRDKFRFMEHFY